MSIFHDQWEFIQAAGIGTGTLGSKELAESLVFEEFKEWVEEDSFPNKVKEALDLIYVISQWLNDSIGPTTAEYCWDLLHANNMLKVAGTWVEKRADGKVLKNNVPKLDLSEVLG